MKKLLARPAACAAAAALGMTGVFVAVPVSAAEVASTDLDVIAEEFWDVDGIQGFATDGDGNVVLMTLAEDEVREAEKFEEEHSNVEILELAEPLVAFGQDELVGGAGYFTADSPDFQGNGGLCSVGFSGWDPQGNPAIITAGHCSLDGGWKHAIRTQPSLDLTDPGTGHPIGLLDPESLGTFGFSQYGGPGDTPGEDGTETSTDIAVIDVSNDDLTLLPEVTDWSTAGSEDLAASTTRITAVGQPRFGEPVAKSGRTTGYTADATLDLEEGWIQVSGRWVHGFGAVGLDGAPGDSGGPIVQGETAVGLVSGGGETEDGEGFLWGTRLQDALHFTDGYTVALHLEAPALTFPETTGDVEPGADITGTAPAGSMVEITPADGETLTVESNAEGQWSFPAPQDLGQQNFSAVAKVGFDVSEETQFSVNVVERTRTPEDAPPERELTIDPRRVHVADFVQEDRCVTVTATGFAAGQPLTLQVSPRGNGVEEFELDNTADQTGVVTFRVYGAEPENPHVYLGAYDLRVAAEADAEGYAPGDADDPLTGSFEVVAGGAVPGEGGDRNDKGSLPRTGVELTAGLGAGAGLLIVGVAAVLAAKRRR